MREFFWLKFFLKHKVALVVLCQPLAIGFAISKNSFSFPKSSSNSLLTMMNLFRKLAESVLFKIVLAFVAVSFVLFGISDFLLGSSNSWVAKVGGTTIGYSSFTKNLQSNREALLASAQSEEALKYVDSSEFKSQVLGRMVNRVVFEKLRDQYDIEPSRELILKQVAKDPNFQKGGKFDHDAFKNFLKKIGINEEKYVDEIATEISGMMIIQTLSLVSPIDYKTIIENENFRLEKRVADTITISSKDVKSVTSPSKEEVSKFFEEHRESYVTPELRKVSVLSFSKKELLQNSAVSDEEIAAEYEKNKEAYTRPESRDFYHLIFAKADDGKAFLKKLESAVGSDKSKLKAEFAKLAKELQKKDLAAISLTKITKKSFIPELSDEIFKLNVGDLSPVLPSPLGYHVFLLNDVKAPQAIPLSELKNGIKQQLAKNHDEKILQQKIDGINDAILTANSLSEVAKKFSLTGQISHFEFDQNGKDQKGSEAAFIKSFDGLASNSFALKKGQISKIFYNKNSDGFYVVKLEEISESKQKNLDQVSSQISHELTEKNRQIALEKLAAKISAEVKANPSEALKIAAKYQLKVEKNHEFPRSYVINFNKQQMPYKTKFLEELFALKVGQSTNANSNGKQEFMIGILRQVKQSSITPEQLDRAAAAASNNFKNEILQEFNAAILKENPVKVNEKLLGEKEEK